MTVASLGFAIDSGPLAATTSELDKMTSAAARTEQAATKVSGAGTRMSRGFADLNPMLDKIIGSLGRLEGIATSIDKRLDAMAQAAGRAAKSNQVLDKSAIEASTAYKQLEASLNAVTAAQRKSDGAYATSLAQIQKQKDAIAALNAELQKLRTAPAPTPGGQPGRRPSANSNFQTGNIASQLFDIGSTAAFMSPATVGLQQGPQLAQAFAGQSAKQALTGLAAGFAAILSPVSLAAIGLTTAAAAAIHFGSAALASIGSASDALEKHDDILKRIKERYDSAAASGEQFGRRTQSAIEFSANQDRTALQKSLETGLKTFAYRATPNIDASQFQYPGADIAGITQQATRDQFGSFTDLVTRFINEAREGKGDVLEFNRQVQDLANTDPSNKAMQRIATTLLGYTEAATKAAQAQKELNDQQREFSLMTSRTDAAANAQRYDAANRDQRFYRDRRFAADMAGIGARSPAELAAAERRRLEADPIDPGKESPENRATRIDQQVELVQRRAQQQLAEAQRERSRNLDKILQDQQSEIDLVGKTGGAAAALRKEYELTSALRLEAARQGIDVDQKEVDLIHERSQALGQLIDQYSQAKFSFDMGQQASDARLSPRQRQITTTLRQYGLPEDLNGANAQRIGQQLDWQEAKDLAKGFGSAFGNELISGSHDLGKALLKGLQSTLENEASKLWEKFFDSVGTMFADFLTGSNTGGAGGGAIGSVAAAITGRTAANSNVAGGFSGLAPVIPVTRAPLGDIGSYAKAIQSIESSGNYGALGPVTRNGDRAYGAYQIMGNNIGPWSKEALGHTITAEEFLKNPSMQDQIFQNKFGSYVNQYGPSGAAQAWFGGPGSVGKGGAGADILGTTGTAYVEKFNAALGDASKNVGTFGSGLGKIGESLSTSFFPAAPSAPSGGGGGGLFSWLGGMFGGGLSAAQIAKYTPMTGLFADGTNYAPGGMAIVGERGPELVNLPQGAQVFNTNRSARMMSDAANQNAGGGRPQLHVHVYGGSGDDHIRELSRQGAQEAIYAYNENQVRGAALDTQQKATARKG